MKELAQRCARGISDGEVMAVGNGKMRIKLSPSSFQREGGQSLIQGCGMVRMARIPSGEGRKSAEVVCVGRVCWFGKI